MRKKKITKPKQIIGRKELVDFPELGIAGITAKIDTGAIVQVPLFINQGDWVKIDTRSASYVERVQK